MSLSENDYNPPLFDLPIDQKITNLSQACGDREYIDAKAYLLKTSSATGLNMYDHLTSVLTRLLQDRPQDPVDVLETVSVNEKRSKFMATTDGIIERPLKDEELDLAQVQRKLFSRSGNPEADDDDAEADDDEESPLPNLMEQCFYLEQAGIGLNRDELVRIWLSMKTLVKEHSFATVRFWGKILGVKNNYIVVETTFNEGEEDDEEDLEQEEDEEEPKNDDDISGDGEDLDVVPKIVFKKPLVAPKEPKGTGVNKMTYFVCTEPGKPWTKLPNVTPQQLNVARQIKKMFTGRLDAEIISYPPFPGVESNYLRAQIARISAGTQISPAGFYKFDEEAEAPEEGESPQTYIPSEEYEPMSVQELVDPELGNWVHHTLHILPQGRTKWWDPKEAEVEGEEHDEEDEEEKEEPEVIEPEVGPPLLTPLSEDSMLGGIPAWTTRTSTKLIPKYAIAVINSCLWPGAHAFAIGKIFDNIYIGWGHKYSTENFNPATPAPVQLEFPSGPDTTESNDPTAEEEAEARAAQAALEGEEEEEEEEDDDADPEEDDE